MAEEKQVRKMTVLWDKFDAVIERITKGRHDLKKVKSYLEERASIEASYAKSMKNLKNKSNNFETTSTLQKCWTDLLNSTQTAGEQHLQFGNTISQEICSELDKEIKKLKEERTKLKKKYDQLLKDMNKKDSIHTKAKNEYHKCIQNFEKSIQSLQGGHKDQLPEKNMNKLEKNVNSDEKSFENSHQEYQKAVNDLKASQEHFDQDLRESLEILEALERERETILQGQFSRLTECHDYMKGNLEQMIVLMQEGVKKIDVDHDIDLFVENNDEKKEREPHVVYEEKESIIIEDFKKNGIDGGSSNAPQNNGAAFTTPSSSAQAPVQPVSYPIQPDEVKEAAILPPAVAQSQAAKVSKYAIANYEFAGVEEDDLSFKEGDKIEIIDDSDPNWFRGRLNGIEGQFPANYVEVVVADSSSAEVADGGTAASSDIQSMDADPSLSSDAPNNAASYEEYEAIFDYVARSDDEISFQKGDILVMQYENSGWYVGYKKGGPEEPKLFPANYVQKKS